MPRPRKKVESGHGRLEARLTRIFRLDDPARLGMFGMHTLVQTRRQWEYLSGPDRGETDGSGNVLARLDHRD